MPPKISDNPINEAPTDQAALHGIDPGNTKAPNYIFQADGLKAWLGISAINQNIQTGNYTLVLSDNGKVIEVNSATATNITVPTNSSVAFPVGAMIEIYCLGVGVPTLVPASGATLRTAGSLTLRAQYSSVTIRKRATDEWAVVGDTL